MSPIEDSGSCPFEGPEKLLEIWFAPSPDDCMCDGEEKRAGLRKVDRSVWEDMLSIVKCKVLSVLVGREMDAYLLRSAAKIPRLVPCIYVLIAFPSPASHLFSSFQTNLF